jgi:hypothetical protein
MRVSMGYEFSLQVADKNFSGEVEDYTVNIVAEGTVLPYKSRSFRNYIIINSFKLDCVRDPAVTAYNVYGFLQRKMEL